MAELQYTVDDIMALEPCYSRERVEELYASRETLTLAEILALHAPATDRLWVGVRLLGENQRSVWRDIVVTRSVRAHALRCGVAEVEAWAEAWLSGADRSCMGAVGAEMRAWAREAHAASAAADAASWALRQIGPDELEWAATAAARAWWVSDASEGGKGGMNAADAERERQIADMLTIIKDGEG